MSTNPRAFVGELAAAVQSAAQVAPTARLAALDHELGVDPAALAKACIQTGAVVVGQEVFGPLEELLVHKDLVGGTNWPAGADRPMGGADTVDFVRQVHAKLETGLASLGVDLAPYVRTIEGSVPESMYDADAFTIIYGYSKALMQADPRLVANQPLQQ